MSHVVQRVLQCGATIVGVLLLGVCCGATHAADHPNVLFIAVDDLRPQLGCYGQDMMKSPHIDALAQSGVLFERAYCMVPTCGASRASLMSGIRPAPTRFTNYLAWAEKDAPGAVTLNTHFKSNGYTTISIGKVFHHAADNVGGWSEKPWRPSVSGYQDPAANRKAIAEHRKKYPRRENVRGMPYESFDAADTDYPDGQIAQKALEYLERFATDQDKPFFLAVGFLKPHLPFCAPKKYWDLYDFDEIHVPENYYPPKDAPAGAVHNSGELRAYATIPPTGPVNALTARKLIHGYYACVSFTDAQVGKLLDALESLNLDDNTIVVLWGDHGWQLGEHGMWNKHSCFETSMHAPLLVRASQTEGVEPGTRVPALTEFIDIYPSLCELCGLSAPDHLEGRSFVPLMKDPRAKGKPFAVGRFRTGDTIRGDHWRYSEYRDSQARLLGQMLYDHQADPDENVNVVADESAESIVRELSENLQRIKGKDQRP